jgi:uncharacterized protein YjdB
MHLLQKMGAGLSLVIAAGCAADGKIQFGDAGAGDAGNGVLRIVPDNVTLQSGKTQIFSATIGGAVSREIAWFIEEGSTGGDIDSNGFYTAPTMPGVFHLGAISEANDGMRATATVTVLAVTSMVSISVSPPAVTLATGASAQFSAAVTGTTNVAVSWHIQENGGGSVDASGLYTAPAVAGTFHLVAASVADPTKSATCLVTVLLPVGIFVAPASSTLRVGQSVQLAATVTNTANTGVTWSVLEGDAGGSVDSSGLYTPLNSGTFHVVATSQSDPAKSASATVNVTPAVAITVAPSATSLRIGQTQALLAVVTNTDDTAVTWSVQEGASGGSVDATGVYTAPSSTGVFHVVATSQADPAKSASATLTVTPAIAVSISPTGASIQGGQTQQFAAAVTATNDTAVAWSLRESAGGSVTTAGLYTAPMVAGTYHVVATSHADASKSAAVAVAVSVPTPIVSISPKSAAVRAGLTVQFSATVANATNTQVVWSVQEGASGGAVSATGLYTAPPTPGTYHVLATSAANSSVSASANLVVRSATPPIGSWVNVTPANVDLTGQGGALSCGNYGTQTVVVDPARPSDLYALFDCQGLWKSTDFGYTWNGPINIGTNGGMVAGAGGLSIPPNSTNSPPIMYVSNIRSPGIGFWRSLDGGISWTNYNVTPGGSRQDFYAPAVDPYDANHLLMCGHEMNLLVESSDGGKTWRAVSTATGMAEDGGTAFAFFLDTGVASTTRTTFLWVAQQSGGFYGTWRTSNDGAQWTQVDKNEHPHGNSQIYQPGNGVVYMAGAYSTLGWGVLRSADYGQTWSHAGVNGNEASVVGTSKKVYAMYGWAIGAGQAVDPGLELATQPGTGTWTSASTPSGMSQGPASIATTFDGSNNILVGANYNAGLWFYAEP